MKGWSWYAFLYNLADGRFLDIEKVAQMNFIGSLNHMAYKRTQENYIKAQTNSNGL